MTKQDATWIERFLRRVDQSAAESDRLSDDVMEALVTGLGAEAVWVYAFGRRDKLHLVGEHGLPLELIDGIARLALDAEELAVRCAASGRAAESSAGAPMAATDRTILESTGADMLRAIPLVSRGDRAGVLLFAARHPFDACRERRLPSVVTVLALTLGAMRASRTARCADKRLERTIKTAHELAEFLAQVPPTVRRNGHHLPEAAPPFDVTEYFRRVISHARDLVGAELGAIGTAHSRERAFNPWVAVGVSQEARAAIGRNPRPVGVLARVALDGETISVDDVRREPGFGGVPQGHPEIRSFLGVPLRSGSQILGNLYLANKRDGTRFEPSDEKTIEMLGALAGGGLRLSTVLATSERDRTTLRRVLEAVPDGIVFVDASTGYVGSNPAFEVMLGRAIDPALGASQELGIICAPDGRPLPHEDLPSTHALAGRNTTGRELLFCPDSGPQLPVSANAAPVQGADGTIIGAVVTFRDVSAQKEIEKLRCEFEAMVVHDLRNPIQSILMGLELLQTKVDIHNPLTAPLLERLQRSALGLAQIARDLLDAARVDLARIPLKCVSLDVAACSRAVVERMRSTLGARSIVVEASEVPPAMVDPIRLDQILTNLIENAGKYSAEDTTIRVAVQRSGDGVEIAVTDQGMGIAPEEVPKLFDRFYQTKRARDRGAGLGLGLYITKGFVEAHGGRIEAESKLGEGSTFRVWLPFAA
jgi:PAS domain S-box-containing protein